MTAITLNNYDAAILADIRSALAAATLSGAAVFSRVEYAGSLAEAKQKKFTGGAFAAVIYLHSDEYGISELRRGVVTHYQIVVADKASAELTRAQAVSGLVNSAKNAVETTPPSAASDFSIGETLYERIVWGVPDVDSLSNLDWAACVIPLSVAHVISSKTTH